MANLKMRQLSHPGALTVWMFLRGEWMIPCGTNIGYPLDGAPGKIWAVRLHRRQQLHPGEKIALISLRSARIVRFGNMYGTINGLGGTLKEVVMWNWVANLMMPQPFQHGV